MPRSTLQRIGALALPAALTWLAWGALRGGNAPGVAANLASYAAVMLVPGLAFYLLLEESPDWTGAFAAACVVSPVILAVVGVAWMASGQSALGAARVVALVALAALAIALWRRSGLRIPSPPRRVLWLLAFLVAICALTTYLPMTREWWRIRSDAWAHRAYVAEVADFGVPPQDPYFLGFPLQYMWAYHVLILVVSRAIHVDPFWTMALLNVQALAGLIVSTFLFAGVLVGDFPRRMMSAVTVVLGLNAAFWVFIPLKLLKAFTGSTRGTDEISRQLALHPLTYTHAMQFMRIFRNKEFFLDKFMVATAFGLGVCLMAAAWYAATRYISTKKRYPLALAFVATLGMLAFHTLVGSVMLVAIVGAAALMHVGRRGLAGYDARRSLVLVSALLAALVVAAPYLYSVMHSKATIGQISLALILERLASVTISVAFVLLLAAFQRRFIRSNSPAVRFVVIATLVAAAYALAVPLPGPNSFDKPVFFVFFPLAVVGSWSLVDLARRGRTALSVAIAALAFIPVNTLAFVACFHTPPQFSVSADERDAASWIRTHTDRSAVLLDDDDRVVFVVTGPRRHYWGRFSFAYQWGYDRLEVSRRYHAWRIVYSNRPIDSNTLAALGSVHDDFFVVVRRDRHAGGVNATRHPEYFHEVYSGGTISLMAVNTKRCRDDAESGRFPTVSEEELFRESGLK